MRKEEVRCAWETRRGGGMEGGEEKKDGLGIAQRWALLGSFALRGEGGVYSAKKRKGLVQYESCTKERISLPRATSGKQDEKNRRCGKKQGEGKNVGSVAGKEPVLRWFL